MKKCLKLRFLASHISPLRQVALCHLYYTSDSPVSVVWVQAGKSAAVSPGAVFPPAFSHLDLKNLHVFLLGTGEGQSEGDNAGLQVAGAVLAGACLRGFGCNRFGSQQAPF